MLTRREFDAAGARRLAETGMPYALVAVLVVSALLTRSEHVEVCKSCKFRKKILGARNQ
jgi:hypothetical protein